MTVKDLKNQLEFLNENLEVVLTVECECKNIFYIEPKLVIDELIGDVTTRYLVIEPSF